MSATLSEPDLRPARDGHDDDDPFVHLFCDCDEDMAVCGLDLSDCMTLEAPLPDQETCIVCTLMTRCQLCRKVFTS